MDYSKISVLIDYLSISGESKQQKVAVFFWRFLFKLMKEGLFHSYTIVSVFEMCKNNICEVEVGDSESNNTWGFYIFFIFT